MFSKESVGATEKKLLSFSPETENVKLDKFKQSIETTFNSFIIDVKKEPLANQLKFIEENLEKQLPLKRRQHFLFFLAVTATVRGEKLTENHPEKAPINELLSHLSNGFINGFTGLLGAPNIGLVMNVIESFNKWFNTYKIDDPEMSHNVLLAFYCMACFFETQLDHPLIPKKAVKALEDMKKQIEQQFSQLENTHGDSLKNSESSHRSALQQLTPEKQAYKQFQVNLASIKEHEAKVVRMMQLRQILSDHPRNATPKEEFWKHYQTQAQFKQLMDDLEIKPDQRKHWQPFFDAEHGDFSQKLSGGLFIILPNAIGGTPSDFFTTNMLTRENALALGKLKVNLTTYKDPTKLVAEIEAEFNQLKDVEKKDIQTLKAHQSQIKSTKGIKEGIIDTVLSDVNAFQQHLLAQEQYVLHLQKIHTKILELEALGIKTDSLLEPFKVMLNHAVETVPHGDKQIDQKSPEEKIDALLQGIRKTQTDAVEIKNDVARIQGLVHSDSNDALLSATDRFIQKHEKNFLHKILCFFSKTYKEMFESLQDAVKEKDTTRIASILVGKAEEYAKTRPVKMLFDEAQELQTLKTAPANNG
ncbi:hypothetical protein LEAN103870_14470 [Legionella anisa]|uniref:Type IV secretion protein Dot n=1 Tax=Legionella anisa TaxID=28082 RepID=A0AAX0WSR4_9GAMM|nr:hypothetical protein [Legionella anisa]AWN74730.1 hypothetical protein DLD14_13275 [Legionella anisa]KTC77527.1 hypothetical protein Lani_0085 [Legionella anisa]MBN5934912.1 hypothetical protein [Legionella anisa]MCW8425148.1 hypothetical protein [Legionella anisa]MCW8445736.1 hypothetical protein [Legionella anisa]